MKSFNVPSILEVDAYQLGHFLQIPPGMEHFELSQATFRSPLHYGTGEGDDHRIVSAGVLPFVQLELLNSRITEEDIERADWFLDDFHATATAPSYRTPYPYPREMFVRIVEEFDGRWPVCVMALPDGQTHYVGEPQLMLWTDEPGMGETVGWLESTLLPYLWASSVVATRGRKRKERFLSVYRTHHPSMQDEEFMLDTKFHDFGRRGGAASQITGIAHLINWLGTDTVDAAYAASQYLNGGRKFGANSIIAAAHRTVTPWKRERQAVRHAVERFKGGIFAFVADSYDYLRCMKMLGQHAQAIQAAGGFLVGRPDSGDPVACVVDGLRIFDAAFGSRTVDGLRILNGAGIIQGDGVSDRKIFEELLPAVIRAGFSPLNVAFGMGEYNHRAVRSDLESALKTAMVGQLPYGETDDVPLAAFDTAVDDVREELGYRMVMKGSESRFKRSIPGPVAIDLAARDGRPRLRPISVAALKDGAIGDYRVLYDGRRKPLQVWSDSFDAVRDRAQNTWNEHVADPGDTFAPELRRLQEAYMDEALRA
ncbi:MAG: hypothetical protein KDD69_10860 [Bdellovibrionales bacterium]|nr:hypothetical protein [Bdellovibrionales bacterium]